MSILDDDLDITVEQLDKSRILQLIHMSNHRYRDYINSSNLIYKIPSNRIRNHYKYVLVIIQFINGEYTAYWELNKIYHNYINSVIIDNWQITLDEFIKGEYYFEKYKNEI